MNIYKFLIKQNYAIVRKERQIQGNMSISKIMIKNLQENH